MVMRQSGVSEELLKACALKIRPGECCQCHLVLLWGGLDSG